MNKHWQALLVWVAAAALGLTVPAGAHAGRFCEARPLTVQGFDSGLTLAEKTLSSLSKSGHKVVVLARAGQDLSAYGLRYSHLGLAYLQPDGQGGQVWRVLHKLNDCGSSESAIHRQGLGEFFLDDPWRFEAAWAALAPDLQDRLLEFLLDSRRATRLHHKPYNMVSYAWGRKYQQSNQWVIETLAAAAEPAAQSREKAQAWLRLKGYEPTALKLGPFTRLGARLSSANLAFDDHPGEKRFSDRIETVTADSVFDWLQRAGLTKSGQAPTVLGL